MSNNFKKQFRGYNKDEVDSMIDDFNEQIKLLQYNLNQQKQENEKLKEENAMLNHRMNITEKTNEEIARLALKEASDLIEKAKRNANMILKESMDYVKGLGNEVDGFKDEAVHFRAQVAKISRDMLETIDKSEIFSLINEERNTKKETVDKKDF